MVILSQKIRNFTGKYCMQKVKELTGENKNNCISRENYVFSSLYAKFPLKKKSLLPMKK